MPQPSNATDVRTFLSNNYPALEPVLASIDTNRRLTAKKLIIAAVVNHPDGSILDELCDSSPSPLDHHYTTSLRAARTEKRAAELKERHANERRRRRAAEERAEDEAERRQIADTRTLREAERRQIADTRTLREAERRRVADTRTMREAERRQIAERESTKARASCSRAKNRAAEEATKRQVAEERAEDEAERRQVAEERAEDEAERRQVAEERAENAERRAAEERQAREAIEKQAATKRYQKPAEVARALGLTEGEEREIMDRACEDEQTLVSFLNYPSLSPEFKTALQEHVDTAMTLKEIIAFLNSKLEQAGSSSKIRTTASKTQVFAAIKGCKPTLNRPFKAHMRIVQDIKDEYDNYDPNAFKVLVLVLVLVLAAIVVVAILMALPRHELPPALPDAPFADGMNQVASRMDVLNLIHNMLTEAVPEPINSTALAVAEMITRVKLVTYTVCFQVSKYVPLEYWK